MAHTLQALKKVLALAWLPYLVALAAAVLYLVQSWGYAHSLDSVLDEGAYLYKGYAFVSGQYRIYQDYGFWSNHMPLSFYIPGAVQALFEPGLRTGRYYAFFLGALMLLGLWIVTRRLGGSWWAALVLVGLAVNPAIIKMYSPAITQVLISCMLVWVLVLTLGGDRPTWQLMLGAMLAAAMWMTRINLFPLLPLLLVYIFWEYGRKTGLAAALAGGLTLLLLHIPFWPDILRFYTYWLPDRVAAIWLDPWRPPQATPYWNPSVGLEDRFNSFFRTYRFHFLALTGVVAAWILWPRRSGWKSLSQYRSAVFLSTLFLALFALHFWATMGKNYCAYCLEGYTAFFASLGWLLLVLTFSSWSGALSRRRQVFAAGFVLIIATGVGYSAYAELGRALLDIDFPLLGLPTIAVLLENKYQIPPAEGQYLLSTLAGLIAGIAILVAAGLLVIISRKRPKQTLSFGYTALLILFLAGVLLTSTAVLGRGYTTFDCGGDVISSYESVGAHLARVIPPGSSVYWVGGLSFAPLLYVPGVQIYPSQVNGGYSFYLDGDADELERYGFWNPDLANQWLNETDYALVEQRRYRQWFRDTVDPDRFVELESTPDKVICRDDSRIRIFKRLK